MTSEESCSVDVTMVDPVDLSPGLSPKMSDLTLSDYYTIATVLDQSPDDRNNTLTSFSNPNYGLDAINSNLFVTSSYDDDDVTDGKATEAGDVTEASDVARPQKKDSRGGQGSEDSKRQRTASEDEGEDTDRGQEIGDGVSQTVGNVGNANETGENNTTTITTTTTATAKTTNLKAERKGQSLFQDIYSPDSNDSGIQADVPQTRHHSPSDLNNASSSSSSDFSSSSSKDEDRVAVENVNNIAKDAESKEASSIGDVIYHCGGDGAPPSKQRSAPGGEGEKLADPKVTDNPSNEPLPYGWQKHEDISGAYYWHIKSGTIQREPPSAYQCEAANQNLSKVCQNSTSDSSSVDEPVNPRTNQMDAGTPSSRSGAREDRADDAADIAAAAYPMRFAVRSLGWVQISEDDLTPERSSRSVNKCIVGLSLGRNDLNDVVGRWGDGKSLYMELDEENLVLIDPQDMCLLNIQPIQSIRVWGVGRSNGRERDFAYVARDSITHKYMCHVFRCDGLARHIAGALRDVCKKILTEKSTGLVRHQRPGSSSSSSSSFAAGGGGLHHGGSSAAAAASGIIRPNNLPNLERIRDPPNGQHFTFDSLYKNTSFPTPMEEPKKVLRCHYLGTTQVLKPTGVEILNNAIESVYMRLPPDKWTYVNVAVAPSTITIIEHGKPENVFAECRVRFLSFMGIAMNNIRLCSYIMHCAEDQFIAHIFHCDPSAGALCKTIEAACKLRYQKCLDAHLRCRPFNKTPAQTRQAKGIGLSIRHSVQNIIGNLTKGCKPKS